MSDEERYNQGSDDEGDGGVHYGYDDADQGGYHHEDQNPGDEDQDDQDQYQQGGDENQGEEGGGSGEYSGHYEGYIQHSNVDDDNEGQESNDDGDTEENDEQDVEADHDDYERDSNHEIQEADDEQLVEEEQENEGDELEEDEDDVELDEEELDDYWSDFVDESPEIGALISGNTQEIVKMYPEFQGVPEQDSYVQMTLKPEAFSGLIGNSNADFANSVSSFVPGQQGEKGGFGKLDLGSMLLGVGKTIFDKKQASSGEAVEAGGKKRGLFGKAFKAVLQHGLKSGPGQQTESGGFGGVSGILKGLTEGKGVGAIVGGLLAGSGGGGNRGPLGELSGGGNISNNSLSGGLMDDISNFLADGLHKFLGVDPKTGKIIGAIAGNLIFRFGGKDNILGNKGKIILDNILSGKSKRKVEPFVSPATGYKSQDFNAIRQECLRNKQLFEDDLFPANDQSLYYSHQPPKSVQWLRPGEICSDPQLFVEGHSRFDVVQGELGDCWLLAAAANLTLRDELFYRVVPPDQSFTENYAGIFHFQFWHYGKWVDIVIDDRLPCHQGKLLYMHSHNNNEFWSALFEKAYAKLYGSYESLKGGNTCEALEDFTGGITEYVDLRDPPANLLPMMFKSFECGSLMGCSIEADPNQFEARMKNGLVRGHAYSITGLKMLNTANGEIALLRIRNPWGNQQEWNGAWSDHSPEWEIVSQQQKDEIGLTFGHDGEFWMSYQDFTKEFEKLELCHLGPDVMHDIEDMTGAKPLNKQWHMQMFNAEWIPGQTAGGCRNFLKTFTDNPQFSVNLMEPEPGDKDGMSVAIMSVLQKDRRERRREGLDLLPIGFAVYAAEHASNRLSTEDVARQNACARSPIFINLREIVGRFRFKPGSYVMIPSTFEPDKEASFMVRVYSYPSLEAAALN